MDSGLPHGPGLRVTEEPHPEPQQQQQAVKGILKKATTTQAEENAPRLKWDEEKLTITEAQKDSKMKIDEPKTPFIHYDHELDRVLDADEVFRLNGPRKKQAALTHTPPVPSYFKGLPDEDDEDEDDDDEREPNDEPEEWLSSDDEEETHNKPVDHDKFARLRAEHYKIREAVKLGQVLVQEDEDDEDEEVAEHQQQSGSRSRSRSPLQPESGKLQGRSSSSSSSSSSRRAKDDDEDSLDMEL
ncbi:hypothetical protein BGX23_004494 [Mortierella sp. AD031]|nr:hypothetical protein BGX23_004494 [Mortierella sp. AD031]